MGNEEYPADFHQGPAYALVIGIRNYKYGKEPGHVLEDHEFPNLKLADKDASDFAAFLRAYPFINYNVRELINEQAELWNIKDEFETLRRICKHPDAKNPLVIVYFSGHGWADADGRHYLIPYEARRNKLFATALLNREFNSCLNDLQTNRLVVLIDTCHAGAIGEGGIKGAYDFHQDLSAREGRYFIASCGPNQKSYEWKEKENSIFTGRLLELLNGETDDFDKLDSPEIDISDLYPALRDKVVATARLEYGADQEPISELGGGARIVLAINKRVRARKQEESDQEAVNLFLDLICDAIKRAPGTSPKVTITTRLKSYVINKKEAPGLTDFYKAFLEQLDEWKKSRTTYVFDNGCEVLIDTHQFASQVAPPSRSPTTQESAQQLDNLVTPEKAATAFQDRSVIARTLGQTIAPPPPPVLESRPVPFEVGARPKMHHVSNARIQASSSGPIEPPRAKVFVSYSHEDENWLEQFKLMVDPLIQQRIIDLWDDSRIAPGKLWEPEIEKAIASTKVAVLLVSANFLKSKFIQESELPQLLKYALNRGVVIFWIMVSDCMVNNSPLIAYQAANKIKRPLDTLTPPECRTALRQIGEELQEIVLGNR
jgi:hypothetical protein